MISHSTKIRSSRTRHMNAAAPQFGATGLVHLRDKDIPSSVSRKFSGLPDEAARWFREITTFMDKHDLGPYKDNIAVVEFMKTASLFPKKVCSVVTPAAASSAWTTLDFR